jgi:Zn-dependent membrane protease YugP
MSSRHHDNLIAVYDDEMKTIYLPENWTGNTPAELSVLVHEMVHHLQSATPTRYECPQAREELAYIAQETWLTLFGLNLQDQFNIDPLTFVVSTRCIY